MKPLSRILVAALLLLGLVPKSDALARGSGGSAGNGGICAVVRNGEGAIVRARLLDLIESEGFYFRPSLPPGRDEKGYLEIAAERIERATGSARLAAAFRTRLSVLPIAWVDEAFSLPESKDFSPKIQLPNGHYEAAGLYQDVENVLRVSRGLYDSLSELDRAAFLAHETLFRADRENGKLDSDDVRRAVGLLFAAREDAAAIRKALAPEMLLNIRDVLVDVARNHPKFVERGYDLESIAATFRAPAAPVAVVYRGLDVLGVHASITEIVPLSMQNGLDHLGRVSNPDPDLDAAFFRTLLEYNPRLAQPALTKRVRRCETKYLFYPWDYLWCGMRRLTFSKVIEL